MKKRILIMTHYMEIGGAESSLVGLLQSLDYDRVAVDLFIYSHQGALMPLIPDAVNLLPEDGTYALTERDFGYCLRHGRLRAAWAWLMVRLRLAVFVRRHRLTSFGAWFSYVGQEFTKILPDIRPDTEYDLAISFVDPHNFLIDHVRAKRKVGWVHSDYTKIVVDREVELPVWRALDRIVTVSDDVTRTFLQAFPELAGKIVMIENILSPDFVRRRADAFEPEEYGACRRTGRQVIASVGRITFPKNYDNIPYMVRELLRRRDDFHWFVIGPGDASEIERTAAELGVQDYVSFLGPRTNPYPYIKNCDLYLHPSRYEGKSVVVREAQILGKTVVITNYATASSQVRDREDGVVVPMDNASIAAGIDAVMNDRPLQAHIADYLASHDFGNLAEIEKIYGLLP